MKDETLPPYSKYNFEQVKNIIQSPDYFSSIKEKREKRKAIFSFIKFICTKTYDQDGWNFLDNSIKPDWFERILNEVCTPPADKCWKETELQEMIVWINAGPAVIDPQNYVKKVIEYAENHLSRAHKNLSSHFFNPILKSPLEDVMVCEYIFDTMKKHEVKLNKRHLEKLLNDFLKDIRNSISHRRDEEAEWACSRYVFALNYAKSIQFTLNKINYDHITSYFEFLERDDNLSSVAKDVLRELNGVKPRS